MNILFIHQNFPGQYKYLAPALSADPANRIVAMHMREKPLKFANITTVSSKAALNTAGIASWMAELESKVLRGEATYQKAKRLRNDGFYPDVICAHPGWGESLFVKEVWPKARLLCLFEYYYHAQGHDVGFDSEFPSGPQAGRLLRLKNINNLMALEACDAGVSPTEYQRSVHPVEFSSKIRVIHEGVDTDIVTPNSSATVALSDGGIVLTRQDEVITFVNRNLEPYRGWHIFARALPGLLERRPNAHILIVGGDGVSYGRRLSGPCSYKDTYWSEVKHKLDMNRVHFLGRVPYSKLVSIFQISSAHIYLTYPFVLSWSMLEAMSSGALVIGSKTPPVEEIIHHGVNGLLVDFFSPQAIIDAVDEVLSHPDRMHSIRHQARQTIVDRYDLKRVCLPRHLSLIKELAG